MNVRPDQILEIGWAHVPQRALTCAIDLSFFTHLADGPLTAAELAAAAGAQERGARMVADALASLGLLTKEDGRYGLTPETETFLVEGKETYLGGLVQHSNMLWDNYAKLTETVRSGRSPVQVDHAEEGEDFFVELVPQIFGSSFYQARSAADDLGIGDKRKGLTILDIGAGSGAWSLAMLERDPTARAIAVDFPHVLDVTRRFTDKFGCTDRYEFRAGNFREVDFGVDSCDLAILGHICHSEGAEMTQVLFERVHRALRPGGELLIGDMIPDEERRKEVFPLLFAINMLLHTELGDTFTLGEYTTWLEAAGFAKVRTIGGDLPSPLIVGTKAKTG